MKTRTDLRAGALGRGHVPSSITVNPVTKTAIAINLAIIVQIGNTNLAGVGQWINQS